MSPLLGNCFGDPPYHYERAEEITVVFETDPALLRTLLPPPLTPLSKRALAAFRVMRHAWSTFGPYTGVYLGAPAMYDDEAVFHLLTGMKTDFAGTVAGREVWGMPLQVGHVDMKWTDGILSVSAGRAGVEFARLALRLEQRTEPPTGRLAMGTLASRRQNFEKDETENVLIGLRGAVDWEGVAHWKASATLQLVGGLPGDDWSILPIHKIVSVAYNTGGRDTLNRGVVLTTW